MEDLRTNYEKEKTTLEEMAPLPQTPVATRPEEEKINQEWEALKADVAEALDKWSGKEMDTSALIGDEDPSQQ